jgi:amino acid adenylation domain-containing protein
MKLDELLLVLKEKNIGLRPNGSELTITGDRDELTATLVSELRSHKSALLALVEKDGESWRSRPVTITPEMLPLVQLTAEQIERVVATVPGGAANVQDIYPLAPLQEGILFHHLVGGDGDPYILGSLVSFDTRERLDNYLQALQAVIRRHDILRSAVLWEGLPEPVQVVWRQAILPVEEVKLEPGAEDPAQQFYMRYNPRSYRIDIRQAPLLRVVIAHDEENCRWLMMQLRHHLAGDHVTQEIMQEEIEAYLLGREKLLPPPLPFRNLVAQARLGVSQEEHEAFFRRSLGDVEEPTMPFGLLNVQGDGTGNKKARIQVDPAVARKIREHARKLGVSAASLCHVAWAQVAARSSGRDDVVFGTVLFGRMQGGADAERAMGLFMNTLPVRVRLGRQGAEQLVRQTHEQLANLLRHEHASLALAQRCSAVPAPTPLFSSLLNYRYGTIPQARSEEKGQVWKGVRGLYSDGRTNYPLTLSVDDFGEDFWVKAEVDASIDAHRVCQYMHRAMESLLDALENHPERPLSAQEVIPESERDEIVYEWNRTESEDTGKRTAQQLFEEQVERSPDAVAVSMEDRSVSYMELNHRANQMARYLRNLGVREEQRVAICAERGLEMLIAILAVWKAGAAYIPLDPAYPKERLRYMVQDSAPSVLLGESKWHGLLEEIRPAAGSVSIVELGESGPWQQGTESNREAAGEAWEGEQLAYLIYTSGSTGVPKGVMVEQRGMVNHLLAKIEELELGAEDVVAQTASACFDISVWQFVAALVVGARVLMVGEKETRDGEALAATLRQGRVTIWETVPSLLETMVGEAGARQTGELERLRWTVVTGEACPVRLWREWKRQHRGCGMVNAYGPTECSDDVTHYGRTEEKAAGAAAGVEDQSGVEQKGQVPIGRPLRNTQVYVLDGAGEVALRGVSGELFIGGEGVGRGYWNRPELTAERFVADGLGRGSGRRLYRSGDRVRWGGSGELEFLGRVDEQVKLRGYRIELGEIEARLLEHAEIAEAAVVVREDGEGERRLVAYYRLADKNALTEDQAAELGAEQLRLYLGSRLPQYMLPAAYVRLEKFPLTLNGKLDRKSLPAPEAEVFGRAVYQEPVGEVETTLAAMWAELLKLDRVSRTDNFFELGGHSLLVVRVVARMLEAGWQLEARTVFSTPVLSQLAAAIAPRTEGADEIKIPPNLIPADADRITPEMLPLVQLTAEEIERIVATVPGGAANVEDIYPLAPLQEGILFHHLMGRGADPYILGSLYSFDTRNRLDRYLGALQAVIARHDILRTAVLWEGLPEPVQVVWREAILPVEEVALETGTANAAQQLYMQYNPRSYWMDIRQAPLLRIVIAYDEQERRWLMMQLRHHIAGDHTTLEIIQEEIQAYLLGKEPQLPPSQPFRDLVAQARLGLRQEEHEAFFRKLLGDVEEPTAPFGLLNVQGDGTGIGQARVQLEAGLTRRMRERARKLGVSAASLCHVAWAQVLARVSGREDVVFGTVLFGRMQAGQGADRALGLFMNTLPVRIHADERGVEQAVREAHELLSELLRHEHASLALAQRSSAVPAPMPLFSSLLNYRHSAGAAQTGSPEALQARKGMQPLHREERTNYPVTISIDDFGDQLELKAQVETSVDANRVCQYVERALASLIDALENDPARPLRSLEIVPTSERQQMLEEWNATRVEYESEKSACELFEQQVEKTPEAVAVVFGAAALSYRELNRRANKLGHYLREIGVKCEDRVAISVDRGLDMMVAVMAVWKAGAAYLPLDPAYPAERLQYMLADSAPAALLTQECWRHLFSETGPGVPRINLEESSPWQNQPDRNPDRSEVALLPENAAYVIYTSGSTGRPKGVVIPHLALTNFLADMQRSLKVGAADTFLATTTLSFDIAALELYLPVTTGGSVRIAADEAKRDTILLQRELQKGVTFLQLTPTAWQMLTETGWQATHNLNLISGGEQLSPQLAAKLVSGSRSAWNCYGPTETTVYSLSEKLGRPGDPITIGGPMANTRVYILDKWGEPAPVGATGEIYIAGDGVARGYLNRGDLTADRFVGNPFSANGGTRMYRSGDLGRWLSNGTIEFLGRNDAQLKIRGYRIEPGEVEACLVECACVQDAVVIVREDVPGDKRLVAYYTVADAGARDGDGVWAEQLRTHLAEKLPEYMVPSTYIKLEKLPLTPNGKLDRQALPAPDAGVYGTCEYAEPAGEMETLIAGIWKDVLGVEQVGRYDSFFELGGHSLLVVRVMARLRKALNIELMMSDLFAHPTLEMLAERLINLQLEQFEPEKLADLVNLMRGSCAG